MTVTGSASSLPPLEGSKAKPRARPKVDARVSLSKRSAIRQEQGRRIRHQVSSWIAASMVPRRKSSLSGAVRMVEREVKAGDGGKNSDGPSLETAARTFQLDINDAQVEQSILSPEPSALGCLQGDHSDRQPFFANSSLRKDSSVQQSSAQAQSHTSSASFPKKVIIDTATLRDRIENLKQTASKISMVF